MSECLTDTCSHTSSQVLFFFLMWAKLIVIQTLRNDSSEVSHEPDVHSSSMGMISKFQEERSVCKCYSCQVAGADQSYTHSRVSDVPLFFLFDPRKSKSDDRPRVLMHSSYGCWNRRRCKPEAILASLLATHKTTWWSCSSWMRWTRNILSALPFKSHLLLASSLAALPCRRDQVTLRSVGKMTLKNEKWELFVLDFALVQNHSQWSCFLPYAVLLVRGVRWKPGCSPVCDSVPKSHCMFLRSYKIAP